MKDLDFIELTDEALRAAGQVHMDSEQLKALKKRLAQDEENLRLKKTQALEAQKRGALEDAMGIYQLIHPESKEHVQRIIYGEGPAATGTKKVDVDMHYTGTGDKTKGGASETSLRADLRGIEDDKRAIVAKLGGIGLPGSGKQIAVDATSSIEEIIARGGTYEEMLPIYEKAIGDLNALKAEYADKTPFINTAVNELGRYLTMTYRQIDTQRKLGAYAAPTTTPKAPAPAGGVELTPELKQQVLDIWNNPELPEDQKWIALAETGLDTQTLLDIVKGVK